MMTEEYYSEIKNLDDANKNIISKLGIRVGAKFFFMPNFLKKKAIELNAILWGIYNQTNKQNYYPLPKDGRVSFISEIFMPTSYWFAIGYICINNFAVRVDVFEKIFFIARQKIKQGPFIESADLMNPIGCNSDQLANILSFCGFDNAMLGDEKKIYFNKYKNHKESKKRDEKHKKNIGKKPKKVLLKGKAIKKAIKPDPNSPFAVLQKLL